jgi:hypothetical protein
LGFFHNTDRVQPFHKRTPHPLKISDDRHIGAAAGYDSEQVAALKGHDLICCNRRIAAKAGAVLGFIPGIRNGIKDILPLVFKIKNEQRLPIPCTEKLGYDGFAMLKIKAAKWFGRCPRHPMFDPEADGIGAIRGGCPHCLELQEIFEAHQHALQLMRAFAPMPAQHKEPVAPDPDRQPDLFASLL